MIIVVTSGAEKTGKTLVAKNLAAVMDDGVYAEAHDDCLVENKNHSNIIIEASLSQNNIFKEADYVLIVAEPGETAVDDLALVAKKIKAAGKQAGLLINKSKIGQNLLMNYARKEKIKFLGMIPVGKEVAKIADEGRLLIDEGHYWMQYFQNLAYNISGGEDE